MFIDIHPSKDLLWLDKKRLEIATSILSGIVANPEIYKDVSGFGIDEIRERHVKAALAFSDVLLYKWREGCGESDRPGDE